ncbi:MAG: leucine-rich repeat domain-containing protein [Bacteroidales bacterium]|nr:leucine-rich repeat domain-containing protein [Candidatus Colimorpha onthohippi]
MRHLLLALTVVFAMTLQACGQRFTVATTNGQQLQCIVDDDGWNVSVKSKGKTAGDLIIPASVTHKGKTYSVTDIEENGFRNCVGLTSVELPETLQDIEGNAFAGCTSLIAIQIKGLNEIGERAFSRCNQLQQITLPEGTTEIGEYAFEGCSQLSTLTLPSTLQEIEANAFVGCTALQRITIAAPQPPQIEGNVFGSLKNTTQIVTPQQSVQMYKSRWTPYSNLIQ